MNKIEQFFYDRAGYSWDPKTETEEEGRKRNARRLADAYRKAIEDGYTFDWDWVKLSRCLVWVCVIIDKDKNVAQSLSSINVRHIGDPYTRVIEAELALQQLG